MVPILAVSVGRVSIFDLIRRMISAVNSWSYLVYDLRILGRWVGVKSIQCRLVRSPFFVRLVSSSIIAGRAIVGISFIALLAVMWYERRCPLSVSSIHKRSSRFGARLVLGGSW